MNRLQDKKKQEGRVHEHKAVTDKALSTVDLTLLDV